jgi:hypothetical protein
MAATWRCSRCRTMPMMALDLPALEPPSVGKRRDEESQGILQALFTLAPAPSTEPRYSRRLTSRRPCR